MGKGRLTGKHPPTRQTDRHHLKIDDEAFVAAPAVVWIECAVAAALCLTGGWAMAGTLKPVRSSLAESANDSLNVRPEFAAMYRGRAHALR